jgi:hypothetical protein
MGWLNNGAIRCAFTPDAKQAGQQKGAKKSSIVF